MNGKVCGSFNGVWWGVIAAVLLMGALSAVADPKVRGGRTMIMMLTSTVFFQGGMIPYRYTCDGQEVSPPLAWSGLPAGTKSLVLIVDDPDAPRMAWVHWVLYNIPPAATGLPEGIPAKALPDLGRPAKAAVEKAMQGHILGQAELMGQYQRGR